MSAIEIAVRRTSREEILESAVRVAIRDGLLGMTLEKVAREAGVSKGGLIYHFASKEALVREMLEYFWQQREQALLERIADDPNPRGRWLRALVDMLLSDDTGPALTPLERDKFMASLLAAALVNPELVKPVQQCRKQKLRARILAEESDPMEHLMILLAVDGLFLWRLVGLVDAGDPLYGRLVEAIRSRVQKVGQAPQS